MLRSIWQRAKDIIYDTVNSVFRTQSQIDDEIEARISDFAFNLYFDANDIPADAKIRQRQFWTIEDLERYVKDGGIPPACVHVLAIDDWDDEGNRVYRAYIQEDTP